LKSILPCLFILLFSCSDKKGDIKSIGKIDNDSLETGYWRYYSDSHKLLEEGEFKKGIRYGTWKYFIPIADTINWNVYNDQNKTIVTNIPDFLEAKEESDSIVVFKHRDPQQLFTLAIGVNYNRENNNFETYKQAIFRDLELRNVQITDSTSYIVRGNKGDILYTSVFASETNGRKFRLFNVARLQNVSELIEVSLRCDSQLDDKGRKVFFSVIPNLFINGRKFIDGRESIVGEMRRYY